MGIGYTVRIMEMSHYMDAEGEREIKGFPSFELAREYAKRWVRSSLEELRQPNQGKEELRRLWFTFGDDAMVVGSEGQRYSTDSELDFFIEHPASKEEQDFEAIVRQAGIHREAS